MEKIMKLSARITPKENKFNTIFNKEKRQICSSGNSIIFKGKENFEREYI